MLTSRAQEMLAGAEWCIVDEIHAVASTKRGAHLALTLERLAGHDDLVAPPMFAAVYAGPAFAAAMRDPELGIDLTMLVHGGQEFEWGPLVVAGDQITTAIRLAAVSRGSWTVIVRPRE